MVSGEGCDWLSTDNKEKIFPHTVHTHTQTHTPVCVSDTKLHGCDSAPALSQRSAIQLHAGPIRDGAVSGFKPAKAAGPQNLIPIGIYWNLVCLATLLYNITVKCKNLIPILNFHCSHIFCLGFFFLGGGVKLKIH